MIPGLINAHMHTWQTALRGYAANWTLPEYFGRMHAGLATLFRPDDIHIATLVGAFNQINCGTTTLVDWCHNNPTPEHTDAAVAALTESGIRAAFFHGSPKPDPKPGQPHFSEVPHPRREVERLRKGAFAGGDGLMTLGLPILGPHYSTLEVRGTISRWRGSSVSSPRCTRAAARRRRPAAGARWWTKGWSARTSISCTATT